LKRKKGKRRELEQRERVASERKMTTAAQSIPLSLSQLRHP